MTPPIRVVLADDHPLFRRGVRGLLDAAPGIDVVGEAATGADALALVRRLLPDVLLLDLEMPGMTGVEVARALHAAGDAAAVLVLSAYDDETYVRELLDRGAAGYLTKEEAPERIVEAVRGVAAGQRGWFTAGVTAPAPLTPGPASLSPREREVLALIAEGLDNPTVARRLFLSESTVKNHVTNIYDKIEVRTRAEAVAWAWRHGLVGGAM